MHSLKLFNFFKVINSRKKLRNQVFTSLFVVTTFLFGNIQNSYSQTTNSLQTGSTNSLKVSLSNTIGVTTTANTSDNVNVDNQAVLILEPGSSIQDSFAEGDSEAENMSVSFDVSPNGSNVGISGLRAQNNYVIGEGTYFSSSMNTIENNDSPVRGDASAGMYHDMILKVDQTNSSFTSAFSQNF